MALKAISAPYASAGVRWMPTGGITLANVRDFLALPSVVAVGGSWMVPSDAMRDGDFAQIALLAREAVTAICRT